MAESTRNTLKSLSRNQIENATRKIQNKLTSADDAKPSDGLTSVPDTVPKKTAVSESARNTLKSLARNQAENIARKSRNKLASKADMRDDLLNTLTIKIDEDISLRALLRGHSKQEIKRLLDLTIKEKIDILRGWKNEERQTASAQTAVRERTLPRTRDETAVLGRPASAQTAVVHTPTLAEMDEENRRITRLMFPERPTLLVDEGLIERRATQELDAERRRQYEQSQRRPPRPRNEELYRNDQFLNQLRNLDRRAVEEMDEENRRITRQMLSDETMNERRARMFQMAAGLSQDLRNEQTPQVVPEMTNEEIADFVDDEGYLDIYEDALEFQPEDDDDEGNLIDQRLEPRQQLAYEYQILRPNITQVPEVRTATFVPGPEDIQPQTEPVETQQIQAPFDFNSILSTELSGTNTENDKVTRRFGYIFKEEFKKWMNRKYGKVGRPSGKFGNASEIRRDWVYIINGEEKLGSAILAEALRLGKNEMLQTAGERYLIESPKRVGQPRSTKGKEPMPGPSQVGYGVSAKGDSLPFGTLYILRKPLVESGMLSVYRIVKDKRKKINGFTNQPVSKDFVKMLLSDKLHPKKIKLSAHEKAVYLKLMHESKLGMSKIGDTKRKVLDDYIKDEYDIMARLQILLGEISAGSDSALVKTEVHQILNRLANTGFLSLNTIKTIVRNFSL